jgi:hypothetical protein
LDDDDVRLNLAVDRTTAEALGERVGRESRCSVEALGVARLDLVT